MALASMSEIFERMARNGQEFWEVVLADDMDERQVSREASMAKMLTTWQAMQDAADSYTGRKRSVSGLVGGDGMKMRQYTFRGCAMTGGYVSEVIAEALSMAESNACMRRIVAAPTAGACGVLPAVLLPLCKYEELTQHQLLEALYVAAGIGSIIAYKASIAGASGGCQAEIGTASAMAAGADMASVSMHKSGGSLTQSSLLLTGPNVNEGYVRQIINLTQTTSGSYLLMSSLDISRRNLALRGRQVFHQVADMAEYAREEINAVGGYYAFGKELCNGDSIFDFDTTKLSVHTLDIGLAGIEVYDILRDEYDIQIEFGDIGNILAYLSIGDRIQEIERLVSALSEIKRRYHTNGEGLLSQEYIDPEVAASPQEAFYAPKKSLPLRETVGKVCSEFVMCYPPGIPILAPGERITAEILDYIEYAKAKGCSMTGPEDAEILHLNVIAE